ncbi:hypothetical protein FHT86_001605 [Rhizobium sp. BK313]|nr:hypothetical protein [Rhizobium sp. BK313]
MTIYSTRRSRLQLAAIPTLAVVIAFTLASCTTNKYGTPEQSLPVSHHGAGSNR